MILECQCGHEDSQHAERVKVAKLRAALQAFSDRCGHPRAHSLGCTCDGIDRDGTTCRSRHETARAALKETL